MILSVLLTHYFSKESYALWSLFFQFMLFSDAIVMSPTLSIFSRLHHFSNKNMLTFYQIKLSLAALILSSLFYYSFFSLNNKFFTLEIATLLTYFLYNYVSIFLRFSGNDIKYFFISLFKLLIFGVSFIWIKSNYSQIEYSFMLKLFFISHLLVIIPFIFILNFKKTKEDNSTTNEFLNLSVYGASSGAVNGLDKFLISGLNLPIQFLATYSLIYSVVTIPNIIIEAFKKSLLPMMFKDYSEKKGKLRKKSKSKIKYSIIIISISQLIAPTFIFYFFSKYEIINNEYLDYQNIIVSIIILSIALTIFSYYHFINPIIIFFKKTWIMTLALFLSTIIYLTYLYFFNNESLLIWSLSKLILMLMCVTLTIAFKKKFLRF